MAKKGVISYPYRMNVVHRTRMPVLITAHIGCASEDDIVELLHVLGCTNSSEYVMCTKQPAETDCLDAYVVSFKTHQSAQRAVFLMDFLKIKIGGHPVVCIAVSNTQILNDVIRHMETKTYSSHGIGSSSVEKESLLNTTVDSCDVRALSVYLHNACPASYPKKIPLSLLEFIIGTRPDVLFYDEVTHRLRLIPPISMNDVFVNLRYIFCAEFCVPSPRLQCLFFCKQLCSFPFLFCGHTCILTKSLNTFTESTFPGFFES